MNSTRSIFLSVAMVATALLPGAATAQERIVNGNFESFSGGLPTGWIYGQGDGAPTLQASGQSSPFTGVYPAGSNSVLLTDGPNPGSFSPSLSQTFGTVFGPAILSLDFRLATLPGNDWSCIFSAFTGSSFASVVYLSFDEAGNSLRFGPGGAVILTLSANVWYHFEAVADTSTHTLSGSVTPSGQASVLFNSIPFIQNFERFDNVIVADESGFSQTGAGMNSAINLDNFSVRPVPEPTTSALVILAGVLVGCRCIRHLRNHRNNCAA